MSKKGKSGRDVGVENVRKLKVYLDSADSVPARNGKVAITALAEACGVDRQALYRNPAAKALIGDAVAKKGLKGVEPREGAEDAQHVLLERRITSLEQRNAALAAENFELRRKLRQYAAVEDIMCQGKRVIP